MAFHFKSAAKVTQLQSLLPGFLTSLFLLDWLILSFLFHIPERLIKLALPIVIILSWAELSFYAVA